MFATAMSQQPPPALAHRSNRQKPGLWHMFILVYICLRICTIRYFAMPHLARLGLQRPSLARSRPARPTHLACPASPEPLSSARAYPASALSIPSACRLGLLLRDSLGPPGSTVPYSRQIAPACLALSGPPDRPHRPPCPLCSCTQ